MRRSWLRLFWAGVVVAGAIVGYLVSSGIGERLLHSEIELQLSRLLEGPVEIGAVTLQLADGLQVEAREFSAYPPPESYAAAHPDEQHQPALRARRVLARLDPLALLIGRLQLSTLTLEGAQLRVERAPDGRFVALPIETGADAEAGVTPPARLSKTGFAERMATEVAALDAWAEVFVRDFRAADRIEVVDGTVHWIDHRHPRTDGSPETLRLELVNGVAQRDWLSQASSIVAEAVFADGLHAPFPIELEIRREEGEHFDWLLSLSQIPLAAAETPLAFIEELDGLRGSLHAVLRLRSRGADQHTLSIAGQIDDATIGIRGARNLIEGERVEFGGGLEISPGRIRFAQGRLQGEGIRVELQGSIDRPIDPRARTHLESRIIGLRFEDIRDFAASLARESETARGVLRLTERIESGQIRYVQASGTARLKDWRGLASGNRREIPEGFVLGGAFEDISVGTGENDRIEGLAGEIEWIEDQISLRNTLASYRGLPLPQVDAVLEGVSHLLDASESQPESTRDVPPIPGLGPLSQIIRPRDPNALPPVKAVGLVVENLDHPITRWPIRDLRVYIEPLRTGVQVDVREGVWGDASVEGSIVWFNDPQAPTVSAHLTLGPAPTTPAAGSDPVAGTTQSESSSLPGDRWGAGRFEIEFRPRPTLPFERATGFFRLESSNLLADEVELRVDPMGQLALRGVIGLEAEHDIGLDFSFALTEGRLERISDFIRIPTDLATGGIQATGTLAGRVVPDVSFIRDLDGRIRAEASEGRVKTSIPLVLRLSKASEGYNPFANEDELRYESMRSTIDFEKGVLRTEDFEIEGPLRVFANARIDTNQSPGRIDAAVGIFLFRAPNQILASIPLVKFFLPGSDKGLIGAYFRVNGPLDKPTVDPRALESLMSGVPSAIKAPFKVLQLLFDPREDGS